MISRLGAKFLVLAGLFNIVVWPRFAKAIVDDDDRALIEGGNLARILRIPA